MNKKERKNVNLERLASIREKTLFDLEELEELLSEYKSKIKKYGLITRMKPCRNCEVRTPRKYSFNCIECDEIFHLREIAYAIRELEFGSSPALPWCRESFPKLDQAMKKYEVEIGFNESSSPVPDP